MLEEGYPLFSDQNEVSLLILNLRKYISLDDLINGKVKLIYQIS